tara:strand:- start:295 stop:1431 length:1137 start_codon:yes stop_codon:yes gene_type:complete
MGIHRGPNLVKDDLVFGYDTGYGVADNSTATRFYPGEPTTNQADTDAKRNWGTHNGAASSTTTAPEKGPGWKKLTITNIYGTNYRLAQFPYLAHANGTTRTYSVEFDVGSLTGYFMFVDGTNGYAQTNVSGKGRYSTTITASGGNKSIAIFLGKSGTHSSINHVIYYKEYQVEEKSHASPFTDSTRSDTTSLVDLKRTTNIDVSNVSFDSTGQPEFDGTDDYIPLTGILNNEEIGASTAYTVDMWLKPGVYSSRMPFSTGQSGNNRIYYWTDNGLNTWRIGNYTSTSGHGTLPTVGTWYNTTLVINGTNITVYLNGEEDYTGSYTTFNTQHYATFGRHGASTSYFYTGKIAVARLHERVLSAQEVKQNYNAYKNRFNI